MKEINLSNIEYTLDDLILMKLDIESDGEKHSLSEFISSLKIYSTIFVSKGIIIPFSIVKGKNDKYFVYCVSTSAGLAFGKEYEDRANKALETLKLKLNGIQYNLSNLSKKSTNEIAAMNIDLMSEATYFIIDNAYYI